MAAPPDPDKLAAERQILQELEGAPLTTRWGGYLKFIGPGYLQSAMTLGSGTAASSLFAGAVFGYDLLWVAPVGMMLGILAMGAVSHQTLSTGERVLPAMARHAHPVVAWGFALAAMVASIVWHFPQYNLAAASLVEDLEGTAAGRHHAGSPALLPCSRCPDSRQNATASYHPGRTDSGQQSVKPPCPASPTPGLLMQW